MEDKRITAEEILAEIDIDVKQMGWAKGVMPLFFAFPVHKFTKPFNICLIFK